MASGEPRAVASLGSEGGRGAPPLRVACLECDLLIEFGDLQAGQRAECPRCGHLLTKLRPDAATQSLAFCFSALILLGIANLFPFLELRSQGLEQVMSLPRSLFEMIGEGYGVLALMVLGPMLLAPCLVLVTLLAVLLTLRSRIRAAWLVPAGRLLFSLNPWSMVEVFVIGVLVSLVKIGAMATVILGISFWSYVAFSLCFIMTFTNLDRFSMWRRIEALQTPVEAAAEARAMA